MRRNKDVTIDRRYKGTDKTIVKEEKAKKEAGAARMKGLLILFTFYLLMLISLSGQADHELSNWSFPVTEAIAIRKLEALLWSNSSYVISAQQVVEIVNANITSEGLIYWGSPSSAAGVVYQMKNVSGSPSLFDGSEVKKALVRSGRVWEDADALAQALDWLNDPENNGSVVNDFTVEDIHQLVMQNYSVYSASINWSSVANSLQNSSANTSGYSFMGPIVEDNLTYYASTWPFPAPVAQALADINDPDNDLDTNNNDLTMEELIVFAENRIMTGTHSSIFVDWPMVASDINSNSGGATGSLSAGQLLHALGVLYWPQDWAPQSSALGYLNDPNGTPNNLGDDNAFTAEGLLYLIYSKTIEYQYQVSLTMPHWLDVYTNSSVYFPSQIIDGLNNSSSNQIDGTRAAGNTFTSSDLRNMLGLSYITSDFPNNTLTTINDPNGDGTPNSAYNSADLMVALERNHASGSISLGGSTAVVNFTDWAAVASQLGNTEDQLRTALGREVDWPFPADQSTAISALNDPDNDGTFDFNFSPDLVVQIVKKNNDYGLDADWDTINQIFSASTWTNNDSNSTEAPPWRITGSGLSSAYIEVALGLTGGQSVWLFSVPSAQTLAFLNDPNGTPGNPGDDNTFDEASLMTSVNNNTAGSPPATSWAGVTSDLNTISAYDFTQGEVIQAFGLWQYQDQPIPVSPDQALSSLNDPDQDPNTLNGTLTIDALQAYISSSISSGIANWDQVASDLQNNELSNVKYKFTMGKAPVSFYYNAYYAEAALGFLLGNFESSPTEVAAALNDPDYDGVDENNFTSVWVSANYPWADTNLSKVNDPDNDGVNENYWTNTDLYRIMGWQPLDFPWPYTTSVDVALSQLNDPEGDGNNVAKFTPGSLYSYNLPFLRRLTVDTVNGPVTNWELLAQKLSNLGANGYNFSDGSSIAVPATSGYSITVEQIKDIFDQPDTNTRTWPYPRSEAEVMSDLNNPAGAGFSGANWEVNNFTADFILDLIEAYTGNGMTDWVGVASALNQDGVADGTTDNQPDNSFVGSAQPSTANLSFLGIILTGETSDDNALEALSTWLFPAVEAEALAKINQIGQRVASSSPVVYEDFTAYDIITYVSVSAGSLSKQTDWEIVARLLNQYASDPNTTVFDGFNVSLVKSALGILSWNFPVDEVITLLRLNSIGSVNGEATNTFTTLDVLSALDKNGFATAHVVEFDFQLAADGLNSQETDTVGQLDENQPRNSLLAALYWDFPADLNQTLDFFNDTDQDGTNENAFVTKDLLTAVGFETNPDIIDWALATAQLNDPDNDDVDDSAFTTSMVELGFGFGPVDSGLGLADVKLMPGINMISLPNQPETVYTARSLIEHIHTSQYSEADGANVVPGGSVTDVNWLLRYDVIGQRFDAYVWTLDNMQDDPNDTEASDGIDQISNPGFAIEGGQGYIVNVSSARVVQFMGTVWEGLLNPITPAPNLKLKRPKTWAFILLGQLPSQLTSQLDNHSLRVTNLDTGRQLAKTKGLQAEFRLPIVDSLQQSIVHQGDLIRVVVSDPSGQRVADTEFVIGPEELSAAYRWVDLQYNPIPDLTRLLQNYPNPFNPETWIPFELSQDSEVTISIYDVAGQIVRSMEMGFQPAGIYSSQAKAIYWDGKSQTGETVASGIYFYSIIIGDETQTRRMVILK